MIIGADVRLMDKSFHRCMTKTHNKRKMKLFDLRRNCPPARECTYVALSNPTEIHPLLRDRCSNTPVALCFLWYRRLSLLHPHFFPYKKAYGSPKTDPTRGLLQKKLASEAYRARGGVARNSIANCAKVTL